VSLGGDSCDGLVTDCPVLTIAANGSVTANFFSPSVFTSDFENGLVDWSGVVGEGS
jgi:hypothetical protein